MARSSCGKFPVIYGSESEVNFGLVASIHAVSKPVFEFL